MKFIITSLLAAAILAASGSTYGGQSELAVVTVRFHVTEQLPERVQEAVVEPMERILLALPRVDLITATAGHGSAMLEIRFEGGATEHDLESVLRRVEELELGSGIVVSSRTVRLSQSGQ